MGIFDWYRPARTLRCPECGEELDGWQGKDGPCALFLWAEGKAAPVDQLADEDARIGSTESEAFRPPATFVIYTSCRGNHFTEAEGRCEDGVWRETSAPHRRHAV